MDVEDKLNGELIKRKIFDSVKGHKRQYLEQIKLQAIPTHSTG